MLSNTKMSKTILQFLSICSVFIIKVKEFLVSYLRWRDERQIRLNKTMRPREQIHLDNYTPGKG